MGRKRVTPVLAAGLGVLLSLAATPARGQAPTRAETARYLKQIQALFDTWDLNHDGYLDQKELAQAFSVPGAAPRVGPLSLVLLSLPRPAPPVNFTVADLLARLRAAAPGKTTVPAGQQFLALLVKPGQKRVSRKSFSTWAKKHARDLYREAKAQGAVAKAQAKIVQVELTIQAARAKLRQARTAKAVQQAGKEVQKRLRELEKAQATLQKHVQEVTRVAAQLAGIPPAIRQVLALKQ